MSVVSPTYLPVCIFLYYRQALRRQLSDDHSEDSYSHSEYHIKNTDNNFNKDYSSSNYSTNNNTPSHFAAVTSDTQAADRSNDNFNILTHPSYLHDKLHSKDLGLRDSDVQPPEYSRSVSAPSYYPPVYPSAPSETCSVVMETDDEQTHNIDENAPLHLHRTVSVDSNNHCS